MLLKPIRSPLFTLCLICIFFSCQEKVHENRNALSINHIRDIELDISNGFPKLQGNPLFYSNGDKSYFYIQTIDGIGTFDLTQGGKPISYLKLSDLKGYRGDTKVNQNHFIPLSENKFFYFDRKNEEIFLIENDSIIHSQKIIHLIENSPKPLSGVLKFAIKNNDLVTVLNLAETYAKPPYSYDKLENSLGIFHKDFTSFHSALSLPIKYQNKNVNIYDLLISMDFNNNTQEFVINFPTSDSLFFTKDFQSIEKIFASPNFDFVKMENRSGNKINEWKKEYYLENSFFTVYYDPFRDIYIRHYRKALSSNEFEYLEESSFKMLNKNNQNFFLFLSRNGDFLDNLEVSEFNYTFTHFGKEGMYILKDTQLENENSLTFSLYSISEKNK